MIGIKSWLFFISTFLLSIPVVLFSQILNGSFENNDQPTLDGWQISYNGQSAQDAPLDGGNWCLKLEAGNYQGFFPSIAHQIIPGVKNGDIVRISAWAKQELGITSANLYLQIFHSYSESTLIAKDSSDSTNWTKLTVQDTVYLNDTDCLAVVLDAGITSGPATNWVYFDLIEFESTTSVDIIGDQGSSIPKTIQVLPNYPNPFNASTTISFHISKPVFIDLMIFNSSGVSIESLIHENKDVGFYQIDWYASNLPSGIYFLNFRVDGFLDYTSKLLFLK
jgi:hypothetical protein